MYYRNLLSWGSEGSDRQERGCRACGGCWPVSVSVCVSVWGYKWSQEEVFVVLPHGKRLVCRSGVAEAPGGIYLSSATSRGGLSPTLFSASDLGYQVNSQALPRTASDPTALLPLPLGGWTQSLRGPLPSVPQNPSLENPLASGIRMYACLCVQVRMPECEKLSVSLGELWGWDGRW